MDVDYHLCVDGNREYLAPIWPIWLCLHVHPDYDCPVGTWENELCPYLSKGILYWKVCRLGFHKSQLTGLDA